MNNVQTSSFRFQVEGAAACFRRPEFTQDFISYDVMPPFVAVRMLRSLYLPVDAHWFVRYIEVLKPIRFKRDRIGGAHRERRAVVLDDVAYVIAADLVSGSGDISDHSALVSSAAKEQPLVHLGLASFPGTIRMIDDTPGEESLLQPLVHDLGWMLYEIRNKETRLPSFFRAQLRNGRIDLSDELFLAI